MPQHPGAWNSIWSPMLVVGSQALQPSFATFQAYYQGAESEVEQFGCKPVLQYGMTASEVAA